MFSSMGTYLVTGGAGFIGSHIVSALVARGDRVRVLDSLITGHRRNIAAFKGDVDFVEGDLVNPRDVERALEGVEVVFHEAALASVPRSVDAPLDTNAACVTGTVTLLDVARRTGVRRVVFAGSSSVYGDQPTPAKHENLLPMPLSPYAAAKVAGEFYCQAFTATYGLETVTIRYFNVFGPRQDPKSQYAAVIPKFITEMLAGQQPTDLWRRPAIARLHVHRQHRTRQFAGRRRPGRRWPHDQCRLRRVVRFTPTRGRHQRGAGNAYRTHLRTGPRR